MNRIHSHLDEVDLIGKLADLKADHYQNILLLTSLIELLMEKGVITKQEYQQKIAAMEAELVNIPPANPTT
ncbi:MAG TPA: hypothetical protein VF260_10175 [Bacilli bacterium]